MGLSIELAEPNWSDIPGGDGLQGGTVAAWIFVRGPCGGKHILSFEAAMALKVWLGDVENHLKPNETEVAGSIDQ